MGSVSPSAKAAPATVIESIRAQGVLPVITIDDARHVDALATALLESGLRCVEVTLRTPASLEALTRMVAGFPELLIGAGTVLSPRQVDSVQAAGGQFVLSPGTNPAVVRQGQSSGLPVFPGVSTPSEVEQALGLGLTVMKLFPAEIIGGVRMLGALASPYPMASFIPTGGISLQNLASYLALPNVVACGGSWMVRSGWLAEGRFEAVREEMTRALAAARASQPSENL